MSDEAVRYRTSDYSTFPTGNSHTGAGGSVRVKALYPTVTTQAGTISAYEPVAIVPGSASAPDSIRSVFTSTDGYASQVLTVGAALEACAPAQAPKLIEVGVAGPTKVRVRQPSTAGIAAGTYVRLVLDNSDGAVANTSLSIEATANKRTSNTVGYLINDIPAATAAGNVVADVFLLGESVVPVTTP